MIGSGLKKLANENGMKVSHGVAYGSLRGYDATLSEGANYKQIVFSTVISDPAKKMQLMDLVNGTDLKKPFRVQELNIGPRIISVVFLDTVGTMKKIRAFLDWFIPQLQQSGATPHGVCTECGCAVDSGRWVLVNGTAHHMHDACADKVSRGIEADNTQRAEEDTGSYALGLLGALIGAALGAVVWAIVLNLGYVAALVGLLIGWLADKGYDLLHGKQGKGKVVILVIAVIFGVLLGTFGADAFTLFTMINGGELPGFAMGDIPAIILALLLDDAEYRGAMTSNILMGLLFAALGVFALLRKTGKDVSGTKFTNLS